MVGGGVEYFVADNIALGFEARYLRSRDHEIERRAPSSRANLDALLTAVILPLPRRPPAAEPSRRRLTGQARITLCYLRFWGGGGASVSQDIAEPSSRPRREALRWPGRRTEDLLFRGRARRRGDARHLGVELAADGFEINLRRPGLGTVGEYAMYGLVPQVRVRYPVLDNRLVPYLVAGVGAGYAETNDIKASAGNVEVQGKGVALIATAGRLDYSGQSTSRWPPSAIPLSPGPPAPDLRTDSHPDLARPRRGGCTIFCPSSPLGPGRLAGTAAGSRGRRDTTPGPRDVAGHSSNSRAPPARGESSDETPLLAGTSVSTLWLVAC